jgi:hypothetical protein
LSHCVAILCGSTVAVPAQWQIYRGQISVFTQLQRTAQGPLTAPASPARRPSAAARQHDARIRPSRIPAHRGRTVGADARPATTPMLKSESAATTGGVTGINLNVTFTASGTPADGLQAVQTVMVTRGAGDPQLGTLTWQYQGKTWDGFVDGGKNSPYAAAMGHPAHPTQPYFLTAHEVAANVTWDKDHGTIKVTDTPTAVAHYDEVFFETAIVAVNHDGTGRDKLLKAFKWGWTGKGSTPEFAQGTAIGGKPSGVLVRSSVTPEFTNIVKNDYPTYKLD